MVTETKLDDSFPASQFNVKGFSTPFRPDRNKNGGGIILYIRSYIIASKLTSFAFPNDIEAFFTEVNLIGNKCLISVHKILIGLLYQTTKTMSLKE